VGETGLGKSTLVNTLFAAHLIDSNGRQAADEPIRKTVEIQTQTHNIQENGVRLALTIVDTPGYGDQVNNENCWEPIVRHIKDQHANYLRKELSASRERYIVDSRIHCCLYFIAPTGHALKPLDVIALQKLSEVVNVVPVIAKADSLTPEELVAFKRRIRNELSFNNINYFPYNLSEEDVQYMEDAEKELNNKARATVPFAVVGSEKTIMVNGQPVRARKTRWGAIHIDDETHCEFTHLRNFLTRTHLQELVETTSNVHYEAFRTKQLMALKESSSRPQQ
jgi:septin 3/9/12